MADVVRLFVGGLQEHLEADKLAERFKSFGHVRSTELIPFKQLEDGTLDPSRCRGFAYVNLVPKDDGALGRCLSLYNGCKWRGGILRVEVARPAYQLRMAEEAAAEAQAQAHAAQQREREQEKQQKAEVARAWGAEAAAPDRALHIKPLNILAPTGKKVVSQGKVKRFFPPVKDVPVSRLSWDSPPAPATKDRPGKTYSLGLAAASTAGAVEEQHAAARAAEPAAGKRKGGDTALELRNKLMKIASEAPSRRPVALDAKAAKRVIQDSAPDPESEPEEALQLVDFLSEDEDAGQQLGRQQLAGMAKRVDLRRFDSDSESEGQPSNKSGSQKASMLGSKGEAGAAALATSKPAGREDAETHLDSDLEHGLVRTGAPAADPLSDEDSESSLAGRQWAATTAANAIELGHQVARHSDARNRFDSDADSEPGSEPASPTGPASRLISDAQAHADMPAGQADPLSRFDSDADDAPNPPPALLADPLARFDSGSDSPPAAELDPSANTAPGDATDEEELVESSGLSSMEEGNDEDLDMAQAASSASPSASVDSDLTNTSGSDAAAEKSSSEHEEGADAAEDEDHWGTGVQAIEQSSERSEAELSDAAEGSEAELSDAAEGSADSASLRGSGEAVEPADAVAARAPDSSDAQAGASGMLDPELVGLTAGLSFVRPADCTAALAQWHSQREGQMADWKRKRRTALKYITSRKPAAKRKLRYPH